MTVYRATNEETGEVIEGGARDLARTLGVSTNSIYNAASDGFRVRGEWIIYRNIQKPEIESKCDRLTIKNLEDWERYTAPYKALSEKKKKRNSEGKRIRLRTRYNVGVY